MKHIMKPKHECPVCFQKFPTKTQVEHHYVNHHCEADIRCKNINCEKVFKNVTSHKVHYTRRHMKSSQLFVPTRIKGTVKCANCPYEASKSAMYYHAANCSPYSPFSEKFINCKENTCLPCDDPSLERLDKNIQLIEQDDLITKTLMEIDLDNDFFIPSYFDYFNEDEKSFVVSANPESTNFLTENIESPDEDDLIMKTLMEINDDPDFFIPSYFDNLNE